MVHVCKICDSPSTSSLHFGTRSCKACAAFFRRTVALNIEYECTGSDPPCRVHHELRMTCRKCRYDKCIEKKMQRDMVKSRGADRSEPQYDEPNEPSLPSVSHSSPSPSDTTVISRTYTEPPPSIMSNSSSEMDDDAVTRTIEYYMRMQAALNDRRKIMYVADVQTREVFNSLCECPFEFRHLRPFDYRAYKGGNRSNLVMIYDYASSFMHFQRLDTTEKNILYRYSVAVDASLDPAFYTSRLSYEDKIMVLTNGEYLQMDPMPMSGNEPGAEKYFLSNDDFQRYKTLITLKSTLWNTVVVPFQRLNVSFEEYALLKALACWHICYYKFGDEARQICSTQRNQIIDGLYRLSSEKGEDPISRVAELILFLSSVFEHVHNLISSVVMITVFELIPYEDVLRNLVDFKTF